MHKNPIYSKIDRYCDICTNNPCDCDGAGNELRIMGTTRITKTRQEPVMASGSNRIPSLSPVQVEIRIIKPKDRVFLHSVQGDLPAQKGTNRENDSRGSGSDGD